MCRVKLFGWSKMSCAVFVLISFTAWKVSKYGVISDPYFPVFGLNTGKYGPEITPYLAAYYAVIVFSYSSLNNPFHFLATINMPLEKFCHFIIHWLCYNVRWI